METFTLKSTDKGFQTQGPQETWTLKRDIGYSPVQSLVVATTACAGYVYESILKNSQIPHTFHQATVSYEKDEEHEPHPVKKIAITFEVSVPQEKQALAERALRLVNGNCPVAQSLSNKISLTETVKFS